MVRKKSRPSTRDSSITSPSTLATSTSEPTTMDELFTQTGYQLKSWRKGTVVEGTVLAVSPRQVLLDIGGKSEAVVHEKEIPFIEDILKALKVGDKVTTHIVNSENDRGQTVVSLRRIAFTKRWENLVSKMKKDESVEVTLKELSRSGFLVDFMGLRGFIPLSQVEADLSKQGDRVLGRKISVKILEVDRETNRLVFSQLAGGLSDKQKQALQKVEMGKTYKADVRGIAPFGAFVNVKIDVDAVLPGLIHISEIAWEKVENPADYLHVGQTVDVKVIGVDQKLGKLTLSLKQLLVDPWEDVRKVLSVDQTIKGTVTRLTQYGAFVSLLPGIEGLVHISKISPGNEPKIRDEIECLIEDINPERRKISLSLVTHAKPIGYR